MCVTPCERHGGLQFTFAVCEHVASAVRSLQPTLLYVQSLPGACHQFALCDPCIRRKVPEPLEAASELMCLSCVREWSDATGADLVARCDPGMEFPSDLAPWSYAAPTTAIVVGGRKFILTDVWCVVTRTGAWPVCEHPRTCLSILEVPWPEAAKALADSGGTPFPFEPVLEVALDHGPYWAERALSYLFDGFPSSAALLSAARRVHLPPARAAEVARRLAALEAHRAGH